MRSLGEIKATRWQAKEERLQGKHAAAESSGDAKGMQRASDEMEKHNESRPTTHYLRSYPLERS